MIVFSFDELRMRYPTELITGLEAGFRSRLTAREISGTSMGARSFLTWLSAQRARQFDTVRDLFDGKRDVPVDELAAQLHRAAKKWLAFLKSDTSLSVTTVNHYGRRLRWALRILHEDRSDDFPKIEKGFLKLKDEVAGTHKSLGEQNWPELEGLTGVARERTALNMVRQDASEYFRDLETIFWFGQSLISTDASAPPEVDAASWHAIQQRLKHAMQTGSKERPRFKVGGIAFKALSNPLVWKAAGLNVDVEKRGPLLRRVVSKLMDFCMAPTLEMCHSVAVIFCCATAWNRQPIFDIAAEPYLFSTKDKRGIVTSAFLAELKKRAGHDVSAYLESTTHLSPLQIENLRAIIQETELQFPQFNSGAFEELVADGEALEVIDRFRRIVMHVKLADSSINTIGNLFLYKANGKYRLASESKKALSYFKLFKLSSTDYPGIRKTVLGLKLRAVGSIDALTIAADHHSSKTLMPHYINTDTDQLQYSDRIRLAQNIIQAMLVGKRKALRIRINWSDDDLDYYLKLSKISGLAAAMLPMDLHRPSADEPFEFEPSPSYFLTIYLISFSLTKLRLDGIDPARWAVQGRELLIFARGIKLALIKSGLGPALRRHSRRGFQGLRNGTYVLPTILI